MIHWRRGVVKGVWKSGVIGETDGLCGRERFVYEESEIESGGFGRRLVFGID